jgi:hypothetical protein
MRCLKRSLLTDGRSSVWGRGAPSGASNGASLGSGGLEPTLAEAGAADGAALALTPAGADAAGGAETGNGVETAKGAETGEAAELAGVDTASPRQLRSSTRNGRNELVTERARISRPSILDAGAQRPSVESSHVASRAAFEHFMRARHLPGLDGLRCLAILPVIWHHATPHPLPGIWGKGAVGVDLFFALSGFLITTLLLRERRAWGRGAILRGMADPGSALAAPRAAGPCHARCNFRRLPR